MRKSTNPFFQPSSHDFGEDLRSEVKYDAPVVQRDGRPKQIEDEFDFKFLYQSANNEIGNGIAYSDSKLSAAMSKGESHAEISRSKAGTSTGHAAQPKRNEKEINPSEQADQVLRKYNHNPHQEHPMYNTTNNQYGAERPTAATFSAERVARSQTFSNSFNAIKFRDTGLNTSLIRSQVNDLLDFL